MKRSSSSPGLDEATNVCAVYFFVWLLVTHIRINGEILQVFNRPGNKRRPFEQSPWKPERTIAYFLLGFLSSKITIEPPERMHRV
jgi:hypothetical protein